MAIDINIPSQVKNYANLAGFPATGSLKTIFIAEDTNKTYRWTGSAYVEISASQATAWGAITGTLSNQTDLQNALNAKQDTLVSATNIKTINGTTLLGSGDLVVGGGGVTIGTTAITSGTVGRILFEGTGNVVQESANLFWDNTNGRLGIGGTPSTFNLDVVGTARVSGALNLNSSINVTNNNQFGLNYILFSALTTNQGIAGSYSANGTPSGYAYLLQFNKTSTVNGNSLLIIGGGSSSGGNASNKHVISTGCYGSGTGQPLVLRTATTGQGFDAVNDHLTIFPTGNVVIQNAALSATDAGFRLDVNGTARVSGNMSFATTSQTGINYPMVGKMRIVPSANQFFGGLTSHNFEVWSSSYFEESIFTKSGKGFGTSATTLMYYSGNNVYFRINNGSQDVVNINQAGMLISLENLGTPNASALLEVKSTTKGFLPPRMDTTQKNAIASPSAGLMVYDTTLNLISVYNGTTWITL